MTWCCMGRRSKKSIGHMQVVWPDNEIRAAILRDAISRTGLLDPDAKERHSLEQLPHKRQKVDETATAAHATERAFPTERVACGSPKGHSLSELLCTDAADPRLAACEAKTEEAAIEACDVPWPVDDFAVQQPTLQEFALSPLETELLWLREALALSTKREESSLKMCNALRIQLHKAYRLIALHQLNNFSCDTTTMAMLPTPQEMLFSTKHQ